MVEQVFVRQGILADQIGQKTIIIIVRRGHLGELFHSSRCLLDVVRPSGGDPARRANTFSDEPNRAHNYRGKEKAQGTRLAPANHGPAF